jgi:L,D-transpeptidase YcbB
MRKISSACGALLLATSIIALVPAQAQDEPAVPTAPVPVSTRWSDAAFAQLVDAVDASRAEGLRPADYDLAALRRAAAGGPSADRDSLADASARALAHDYLLGRVTDRGDMQWLIERSPYEAQRLAAGLDKAVAEGRVVEFMAALLPGDPRYVALRSALADASTSQERDRLRVNMERWRWMPRSTATDYLYVNVPSYRVDLVEDGFTTASYTAVVGAPDTPTPLMVSPTSSLVVNPAWHVPASIVKKSGLRPGRGNYLFRASADGGYSVVQPPGPGNALGRIKFNLDNDQAIYLHDTNAKAAFRRTDRALSHGCIRVKDIDELAATLLSRSANDVALDDALASSRTATLRLGQTWPVYIVYFTADAGADGRIVTYGDPYGYDAKVLAALDGSSPQPALQVASN